jgi:WD40 repeat protein
MREEPGEDHTSALIGPRGLINRTEFVRILEQALAHLGYPDLATELERVSNIVLQPPSATAFREAVLSGNWTAALDLLPTLGATSPGIHRARFLLLRHKYSEAISAGDLKAALHCLRSELQPLQAAAEPAGSDALHGLAAMLVSGGAAANGHNSVWGIAAGREGLLAELQALLPPSLLVPEARLEELVEQALLAQLERCPYHNSRGLRMSLFSDYVAGPEQLPTEAAEVLDAHADEVWAVQFSPDGRWMATASKDGSALLWAVGEPGPVRLERAIMSDAGPVNIVVFSPDSRRLAVGGADACLRIFSVPDGKLELEVLGGGGGEGLAAAVWLPDSARLMAVGAKELQTLDVDGGGAVLGRTILGQHTYDAALSHDGGTVITVGQDRRLRFLRLSDGREVWVGPEPASVTCLSTSPDGRFLASNMNNGVIHMWPLGDLRAPAGDAPPPPRVSALRPGASDPLDALPNAPIQEFRVPEGHPGRFVIRSAFGGAGYSFLASGSEGPAAAVHIWHRESGEMLAALEGHTGTVNAVAWNPRNQYMLASASDDKTVRVWRAPAARGGAANGSS